MKIVYSSENVELTSIPMNKVPVGVVFRGTVGDYSGVFLRTQSTIVKLDAPYDGWDCADLRRTVLNYRKLGVELHVL